MFEINMNLGDLSNINTILIYLESIFRTNNFIENCFWNTKCAEILTNRSQIERKVLVLFSSVSLNWVIIDNEFDLKEYKINIWIKRLNGFELKSFFYCETNPNWIGFE